MVGPRSAPRGPAPGCQGVKESVSQMARGPNDLAQMTLTRVVDAEGNSRWKVTTWISSAAGSPLRAVQSLKHAVLLTLEGVIRGDIPGEGNGEHDALEIPA